LQALRVKTLKIFFCVLITIISMASQAEPIFDKEEVDYIPRKGENQQPQKLNIDGMPEYPDDKDLRQLNIRDSRSIFYVDISSITSSIKDNIPRIVIVAVSPYGARTVTYEGFDCGYRRYKAYGYASMEGPIRPFGEQEWKPIIDEDSGRYRRTLVESYLCGPFAYAASREKILDRMKSLKPYVKSTR
jgi:hypothetical protein